ncbi:hypothetical protein DHD32_14700 [Arenibacter sp. TNZ]|nr:hypothetical protein [Arenibacter sp. TNZ]
MHRPKNEPGPKNEGTVYLCFEEPAVAKASLIALALSKAIYLHGRTVQAAFTWVNMSQWTASIAQSENHLIKF